MAKVAFILDEMFEDSEFKVPHDRVREAGHDPVVVGLEAGKTIEGKKGKETVTTEAAISEVRPEEFEALVIPGGYSPDKIRTNEGMVSFTKSMVESGKPVAAICHAGWMLAEAGVVSGRTVTSVPAIKTDLVNAGANWVNEEVVEDGNLITSRTPEDLEAFSKALLTQLEGRL
ncbi:protein/nucleic acid deglycase [soil metagenome]